MLREKRPNYSVWGGSKLWCIKARLKGNIKRETYRRKIGDKRKGGNKRKVSKKSSKRWSKRQIYSNSKDASIKKENVPRRP